MNSRTRRSTAVEPEAAMDLDALPFESPAGPTLGHGRYWEENDRFLHGRYELCPRSLPAAAIDPPYGEAITCARRFPDLGAGDHLLGRPHPSNVHRACMDHHLRTTG